MSPRISAIFVLIAICLSSGALLASCDIGTAIKTLGLKPLGGRGTADSDSDSFAITSAFRNPGNDAGTPIRLVSIQGVQRIPSASFAGPCGAVGGNCVCDFYKFSTDPSPVTAPVTGISQQYNSVTCSIPAGISDPYIRNPNQGNDKLYVVLRRTDVPNKNSELIRINTALSLSEVLGPNLSLTKVTGVYKYQCSRTFFEGEGVTAGQVTCVAGQHLGVISAFYDFYVFRSGDGTSNSKGADSAFPSPICGRTDFLKIICSASVQNLRFGLYHDLVPPFTVGITLTSAPEGSNLTALYGYAALPDTSGNCPQGLMKAQPWLAVPASIVQTTAACGPPAAGPYTCPSSFINSNNSLNNTVVESLQPPNFIVTRQANANPCAPGTGDCTSAAFAAGIQAESVVYSAQTPVVCVIPPSIMTGF